jgi:N-acyl-D-aspartate/D-glutamate deacylase
MPDFDVVIKGGTVVDGTRLPRYRADIGIKDGRISAIGSLPTTSAGSVLDAGGHIVAPGFIDVHTHFDGQIFWDPYCTTAGWHGVTSVVLGNCGFGFAPVRPDERDRAMLMMSRNEQIPFASLSAGMPWDWTTFPDYLDSLDRTPKGVNCISYFPISPLMVWVMGLEDAKSGRPPTQAESEEMLRLLEEGMAAGACGWSAQRGGPNSLQADFDGTPFPTDVMGDDLCEAFAGLLGRLGTGAIQITPLINPKDYGSVNEMIVSGFPKTREFSERLAALSGGPVIHNSIVTVAGSPELHLEQLKWLEACHARGNRVVGQGVTFRSSLKFNLENNQTFDLSDAWRSVLQGTKTEQLRRLQEPDVRRAMIADAALAQGGLGCDFGDLVLCSVGEEPALQPLLGRTVKEIAKERNTTAVELVLDLSATSSFEVEFETGLRVSDAEGIGDLMHSPYVVPGPSDGGAHSKIFTGGTFGTDMLTWLVRDEQKVSLEEAHWHLSYLSAQTAGFRDRGFLREGAPADIIVYDLENLKITPEGHYDTAYDMPAGEWRRVQRSEGIRYTIVNGEVTFEDGVCTDAMPGRLLRGGVG